MWCAGAEKPQALHPKPETRNPRPQQHPYDSLLGVPSITELCPTRLNTPRAPPPLEKSSLNKPEDLNRVKCVTEIGGL